MISTALDRRAPNPMRSKYELLSIECTRSPMHCSKDDLLCNGNGAVLAVYLIAGHERPHSAIVMAILGGIGDGLETLHFD